MERSRQQHEEDVREAKAGLLGCGTGCMGMIYLFVAFCAFAILLELLGVL